MIAYTINLPECNKMEKISRAELGENLDAILERCSNEKKFFLITDQDKPDLVLCPIDFFDPLMDEDFGLVVCSAIRYSIPRSTYMPDVVCNFVLKHIQFILDKHLTVMIRDLEDALNSGTAKLKDEWTSFYNRLLEEQRKRQSK